MRRSGKRALRLRLSSWSLLLGVAVAAPAMAEIQVTDDGAGGVVFANTLPTETPAAAASARTRRGSAVQAPGGPVRDHGAQRREDLGPLIAAAAARHGLPESLLSAVIRVESNFNPQAVSPKGARGAMQLMPGTARDLGVGNVFDPAANIDGGARYLKALLSRFGNDLNAALAAYNAGPGAVSRNGGNIPAYAETREYVPKVVGCYHAFEIGRSHCQP